ncbi:hypothetical protein DSO57_1034407 [Entomophthora muscae]|uniref:Uncharacterized protein n=1 Tax=Entomophthora muscae TaxID=34485 RepID=A0ACC2SNU2_9FUNG|nr:hypothetical protein DSO57_1034407 [Entomophthora muscae]
MGFNSKSNKDWTKLFGIWDTISRALDAVFLLVLSALTSFDYPTIYILAALNAVLVPACYWMMYRAQKGGFREVKHFFYFHLGRSAFHYLQMVPLAFPFVDFCQTHSFKDSFLHNHIVKFVIAFLVIGIPIKGYTTFRSSKHILVYAHELQGVSL